MGDSAIGAGLEGMHQTVSDASTAFFQELRRRNYTTPTSYLEQAAVWSPIHRCSPNPQCHFVCQRNIHSAAKLPRKIFDLKIGTSQKRQEGVVDSTSRVENKSLRRS